MSRIEDTLCKALEIAERSRDFMKESVDLCESGVGRDLFAQLRADAEKHVRKVQDIYESVQQGESFEGACTLPEEPSEDAHAVFHAVAGRHKPPKDSCQSELGAVKTALDLAKSTVDFYQKWAEAAEEKTEEEFARRMSREHRSHFLMLTDLEFYLEDPKGYALRQDDQILDGA